MNRSISILAVVGLIAWGLLAAPAGADSPTPAGDSEGVLEAAIARALRARVSVDFQDRPWNEAIAQLENDWKIPILADRRALDEHGFSADLPLTLKVSGVSARAALNLLLEPLELDWMVRDEVVWIAPRESIELETRLYDVADLVGPPGKDGAQPQEVELLVQIISSTIAPESWDQVGGAAAIKPCEMIGVHALVVRQHRREHERIDALLTGLRALQKEPLPAAESRPAGAPE